MSEPDVALTDFLLTLECAIFAAVLLRRQAALETEQAWFVLFFAATSASSLAGGLVHGFFLDPGTWGYRILWPATLLGIGVASLGAWNAAAMMLFRSRTGRILIWLGVAGFLCYATTVLFAVRDFWIAILVYMPSSILLLAAFVKAARATRDRRPALGAAGIIATFAGGAVQQLGLTLHPQYLTHNALYHLVLAAALFLIFFGVAGTGAPRPIKRVIEHDHST